MADDPTVPATPQAGGADPIQPQPQAGNTPPTDPQAGESQKSSLTAADYERMISDLRKEAASHRTKLKKFEDEEAKRQEADLSAQQKLEKRLQERESALSEREIQLQEERNYNALWRAGRASGITDDIALDDAVGLALRSAELKHDESGKPLNATEVMKVVLDARPWLKNQGKPATSAPTAGGVTNPARSTSGRQAITKEYVQQVMRAGNSEYAKLSDEEKGAISRFIHDNPRLWTR